MRIQSIKKVAGQLLCLSVRVFMKLTHSIATLCAYLIVNLVKCVQLDVTLGSTTLAVSRNIIDARVALNQLFCLSSKFNLSHLILIEFLGDKRRKVYCFVCSCRLWISRVFLGFLFRAYILCFEVPLGKLPVEIAFVLDLVNLINKSKLHFVIDVKKLEALTYLHLQVVVCFFELENVHVLQLKRLSRVKIGYP